MKDELMTADEVALFLGSKLLEMADRLRTMDKISPGSEATYGFHMDGVRYQVRLQVKRP